MITPFEQAMRFTLDHEGGFVNHPNDPGGATNMGITLGSAKAYKVDVDGDGDTDEEDIKNLPLEIVMQIYKDRYWNACDCDSFDTDYAIALFDTAVNCGVGRAKIWHERAKGDVDALLERRRIHYLELISRNPTQFGVFKKGWLNRVNDLKKYLETLRLGSGQTRFL